MKSKYLPPSQEWKFILPSVVSASKLGTTSPSFNTGIFTKKIKYFLENYIIIEEKLRTGWVRLSEWDRFASFMFTPSAWSSADKGDGQKRSTSSIVAGKFKIFNIIRNYIILDYLLLSTYIYFSIWAKSNYWIC